MWLAKVSVEVCVFEKIKAFPPISLWTDRRADQNGFSVDRFPFVRPFPNVGGKIGGAAMPKVSLVPKVKLCGRNAS